MTPDPVHVKPRHARINNIQTNNRLMQNKCDVIADAKRNEASGNQHANAELLQGQQVNQDEYGIYSIHS
jgi:hypothetical protein